MAKPANKTKNRSLSSSHADQRTYTFINEGGKWYMDVPLYMEHSGHNENPHLKDGAIDFLNLMAWGRKEVTLTLDTIPFVGAAVLHLIQHCQLPKKGAYYFIRAYHGIELNQLLWLCDVPLLVFGELPEHIYVRKEG